MSAVKKRILLLCTALALTLTGCSNVVLERAYSSASPHSETYWENEESDTLRADSYQDLVNAMLLLLSEHADDGTVRVYGEDLDAETIMESACAEVQQETALGAYLLDYVTYTCAAEHDYYALSFHFGYRRTRSEQAGIINATSTEALPELLRTAAQGGAERLTVRVGYFAGDRAGVEAMVQEVQSEFPDTLSTPWQVQFYPNTEDAGIVEVFFTEQ